MRFWPLGDVVAVAAWSGKATTKRQTVPGL